MARRKAKTTTKLKPADIEQISAYLDGELPAEQTAGVAERIRRDVAWSRTARSLEAVDSAMEHWQVAPLRRDLTKSILAEAHRPLARPAWLRVAAPLAAAAAILVAVTLTYVLSPSGQGSARPVALAPGDGQDVQDMIASVPEEDRFVVENLDVIQDLDVLANFDTLVAIDRLQKTEGDM